MRAASVTLTILVTLSSLGTAARAEPASPSAEPSPTTPAPTQPSPLARLVDTSRWYYPLGTWGVLALPGEADLFFQHVDSLPVAPVDARDTTLPGNAAVFARLRLSPALTVVDSGATIALWRLASEIDVLHDWWADTSARAILAADPRARAASGLVGQRLSQLYLAGAGDSVAFQLGLVRSRWGLGLVSNAGDDARPQTAASPFGVALQGDHVVRAGVSAFPLGGGLTKPPFTVSLAFDGVVDDDTASWSDGDRAYQGVVALQGQLDWLSLGLYLAYRAQDHYQGGTTEAAVVDVTGRVRLAKEEGLEVALEAELATIRGRTSLTESAMQEGSFNVDQLGAIARMSIEAGVFSGVLEVGAASGDTNAFDDEQRAFAMDRDHRAGLLLFREVLMANAAVTVANVSDTDYRGKPPRGSERLATEGAARGVVYVNPRVSFRVADQLHLYAGFLYAASDGEYVDAFWSGLAGGAPRGPRNGAPSTDLGLEVDLGVSWGFRASGLAWRLRLEAAYCKPGEVFADEGGATMPDLSGAWLQAGALW